VLSIPTYSWEWDEETQYYNVFSGLLALDVDAEDGIQDLGRIDHSDLVADSECVYGSGCGEDGYWYNRMRSNVYIEDNLCSVSMYGVKVNELNTPENEITRVLFWPGE